MAAPSTHREFAPGAPARGALVTPWWPAKKGDAATGGAPTCRSPLRTLLGQLLVLGSDADLDATRLGLGLLAHADGEHAVRELRR